MKLTSASLLGLAAVALLAGSAAGQQAATVDTMAVGRRATELFYAAKIDSLWLMLSPKAQESLSEDALWDRLDVFQQRAGSEIRLLDESIKMRNGRPQYWRTAEYDIATEPILLRWVITDDGRVAGMGMGPASMAPPTDDQQ